MPTGISRRRFLHLVGRAGGAAAMYDSMAAMELLPVPAAYAGPPVLEPASGHGIGVVILGAGIAGMTAAYELSKAGYACTILEARQRPGGRNWTVRTGDKLEEIDSVQSCEFDVGDHLYFNAGPARIPHHHQAILGYCKEFGIPLEVMVNDNRAAFFQDDNAFNGQPVSNRQAIHDARGVISELLAKAINKDALDEAISTEDKERVLAFVRNFGALTGEYSYKGSWRAGFEEAPGAGLSPGRLRQPLSFKELLKSDFWHYQMFFAESFHLAATMLQPVGGMDRIAQAFADRLGSSITYGAIVSEIRKTSSGVRIIYRDAASGQDQVIEADYAVCTIPLSVLATIPSDLSPEVKAAMSACHYVKAVKLAFQAERRFWEEDDHIYGGISWTSRDITQIWYPSTGFHAKKGILLGAYIWDDDIGESFGKMAPADRLDAALISGEKLHPQYRSNLGRGAVVCWEKVPYSLGAWSEWSREARLSDYPVLVRPDGPIHLAGEHLSYLSGWQEGAALSAHESVGLIAEQVRAKKG
jgi:monoamine oxidase